MDMKFIKSKGKGARMEASHPLEIAIAKVEKMKQAGKKQPYITMGVRPCILRHMIKRTGKCSNGKVTGTEWNHR
jgi:hypothetical protein